jgi:cytochrome P450
LSHRYRMVKGAMMSFLKPENLQNYLKEMDELVKRLLLIETKETDTIKAVTFMKKLTFTIAFNILFGIKDECTREELFEDFNIVFKAIWSLPVNFPGTVYWRGLKARSRIVDRILPILRKKNEELSSGILSPTSDVISSMLALRDQNQQPIGHHAIIDNCITLVIASHDTSTILISLMIWKLARDPEIYKKVLEGGILWLHINAIVIQAVY